MSFNLSKIIFTQKQSTIFISLFITLFLLFCSSSSFARDSSSVDNQSQENIMRLLGKGTLSCSLTEEDSKGFKDSDGRCFGFSFVWLYSKWLQFKHPEKVSVYNGDWYKSTAEDILSAWSDCGNIKKFALLVKELQNSQHKDIEGFKKEMNQLDLDTDGKKIWKEYSIASLLTLEQLKQLLRENIIRDHKLIIIYSHIHATALFKHRNDYYYFDPNNLAGERKVFSTDDVARLVFEANKFDSTKPSPLALQVFSCDEETQNYPSQQEILDRINTSLVCESNYADENTGLHLAALTGCLESVRYFLNKGVNIIDIIKMSVLR